MAEINDLSTTDASNTARFPENQAPSSVNNGARALEGLVARGLKDTIDGIITTAGSSTVYTASANRTLTAYYAGLMLCVKWHTTCGATPTINIDSLGAKTLIWPNGTQVASSELPADAVSFLMYDGTSVQVLSTIGSAYVDPLTTQGDILYRNASVTTRLAAGTSGYFLKTQGAGADPVWAEIVPGGADEITYDNATSGLSATDVQAAIDELSSAGGGTPPTIQVFGASGTWTKPTGCKVIKVTVTAGGGGGGAGDAAYGEAGAGGGAGGTAIEYLDATSLTTVTVTVGAAGAAGGAGGTSSFGTLCSATGGGAGAGSGGAGGLGGAGSGGSFNLDGGDGGMPTRADSGASIGSVGGQGGASYWGGGGRGGFFANNATGKAYGSGGGGGGGDSAAGKAGKIGIVIVEEYY